ncbi:alpha/beta hydrolase family esterase [Variovorax sp. tm]|uniref:extracellular catalytic domain type 1 short-chain-length polyhydroxyalkanoate depolymerase n=1 Tax=Variovorax atrisoli TaxID=3394203 RepID=UPI003A7FD5EE
MSEATQLTRGGRLMDATRAIQRALHARGAGAEPAPARPAGNADADVIDVESRLIASDERDGPVPAFGEAGDAEQWTKGTFTHQGRMIDYMLFVPAGAGEAPHPRPLILMLHGCTQNPADFAAGTRMNEHARALGAVVLYPAQTHHANGQKCWNWFKPQHQQRGRGEPALLAALTQRIVKENGVDSARVYAAGLSAGGAMADILGHCYPDVFAAVGVHSGLPHGAASDVISALAVMKSGMPAQAKVRDAVEGVAGVATPPTIVFHGDADGTVHESNGMAIVLATQAAAEICEGQSAGGQRFTRTLYAATPGRGVVEHWRLHGAGHAWSGGSSHGSYTEPRGIDASREMLRFFLTHRLS